MVRGRSLGGDPVALVELSGEDVVVAASRWVRVIWGTVVGAGAEVRST